MGNNSSVSSSPAYEFAAKDFDYQNFPIAVNAAGEVNVTAENIIVNISVLETRGFDSISIVSISLSTNGDQIAQTTTAAHSTQLQHGLSYSLHKSQMDSAVVTIQVMNGVEVVAKQSILVKSLLGTAAKQKVLFFQHDVNWGHSTTASDNANCQTVKLGFQLLSGDGKIHMAKQPHFQV
jgi:hypothetical protein